MIAPRSWHNLVMTALHFFVWPDCHSTVTLECLIENVRSDILLYFSVKYKLSMKIGRKVMFPTRTSAKSSCAKKTTFAASLKFSFKKKKRSGCMFPLKIARKRRLLCTDFLFYIRQELHKISSAKGESCYVRNSHKENTQIFCGKLWHYSTQEDRALQNCNSGYLHSKRVHKS